MVGPKGDIQLAIEVMLKRVPNPGKWTELNEILIELRKLAMGQPGYITGETLLSSTDQGTTLVISTWSTINGWLEFAASTRRMDLLDKMRPLLGEPSSMEMWVESPVIG